MYKFNVYHNGHGNCPQKYVQPHIKWCQNNINGHWTITPPHTIDMKNGKEFVLNYIFVFEEEIDAVAFKLRWL